MRLFDKFHYMPLSDPISAISGGIGLVGNLVGGAMQSSAAKKAAAIQQQAAAEAGQHVEQAVRDSNPQITQNAANASDMALRAGGGVIDAAKDAAGGVNDATAAANAKLDPYAATGATATGAMNAGLADGGAFNHAATMGDITIDPGYAFRLQQGQLALQRSAAAHGGALGGGAAKALEDYAQGSASQEYANAFNRYQTDTTNRYDRLFGAAGQGLNASTTQGNNLTAAARYGGDITTQAATTNLGANEFAGGLTYDASKTTAANTIGGAKTAADYSVGGANAAAAGTVGAANAWSGAIGGAANAAGGALLLHKYGIPRPTTAAGYGPPAGR